MSAVWLPPIEDLVAFPRKLLDELAAAQWRHHLTGNGEQDIAAAWRAIIVYIETNGPGPMRVVLGSNVPNDQAAGDPGVVEDPRCPAHGEARCAACSRNPSTCSSEYGGCGHYWRTGMHWDTCPNRDRSPLTPDPVGFTLPGEARP